MKSSKIASSFAFKFTEQFLTKGIGLIISIILARLLAPEDFGQVAIITVFINLTLTVVQSGLGTALVQTKELHDSDYSTVFYISMALAIVMVLALYFLAPVIGAFYNSASIVAPLRFYALSLIFSAFNTIQTAKLQREMRFKATMVTNLVATILAGSIGVALALAGHGIWALVIYNFSFVFLSSLTMFIACRWVPNHMFNKQRAKTLFGFGWKMLISGLLNSLYVDIRSLIIGKKYSTEDLGYYNRGQQFPVIISQTVNLAIRSVMLPVLSSVQDERQKLKNMLKNSSVAGCFLLFPLMVGMALVAEPFIKILLTDTWLPAVFFMQIICIAESVMILKSANLTVIMAMGRSGLYMTIEAIRRIMMIGVLLISVFAFNSIEAIVIGYAISEFIDVVIVLWPMKKLIGYGIFAQIKDLWKILLSTVIMAVAMFAISLIGLSMWPEIIIQFVVGVITYLFACWLLKENSLNMFLGLLKKFTKKKQIKIEE